jgi:hypothetical protein
MRAALLFVASLAVAGLAIGGFTSAPAKAEMRCFTTSNTTSGTWPCKQIASSYTECLRIGRERGWDATAIWFACNTQGYKN